MSQPGETVRRLISPAVRRFIEEDVAADPIYIETLLAYVDDELNAKAAAEKLYAHSNTAYYRLDRIAERTGKDLRRFDEVLNLLVAVKILVPRDVSQPDNGTPRR
jgi:DNA-binding PucR family transcriptional regulator